MEIAARVGIERLAAMWVRVSTTDGYLVRNGCGSTPATVCPVKVLKISTWVTRAAQLSIGVGVLALTTGRANFLVPSSMPVPDRMKKSDWPGCSETLFSAMRLPQ